MMGGTMNKQEMDKHSKNLKKLRKYTAKQGDQMVPVPDFIKGTLTRKLHEFDDMEIRYLALHADILKKLDTPDVEETYASLKQSMIGERLEALEFFYSTYFKPDINESVFSKKWWAGSMVELLEEQ
jgi:hypothetical protein